MTLDFSKIENAIEEIRNFFSSCKRIIKEINDDDDLDTFLSKVLAFYTKYQVQLLVERLYMNGPTTKEQLYDLVCEKLAVNYSYNKNYSEKALVDGESPLKNSDPGWLVYLPDTGVAPTENNSCGRVLGVDESIDWSKMGSFSGVFGQAQVKKLIIKNPGNNTFTFGNSILQELYIINPKLYSIGQNFGSLNNIRKIYGVSIQGNIPGYAQFHYRNKEYLEFAGICEYTMSHSSVSDTDLFHTSKGFFISHPTDEWIMNQFVPHLKNYNEENGGTRFVPINSSSYGYSRPYWRMTDSILINYMSDYNLNREEAKEKIQSFFTPVGWKIIYDDSNELNGEDPFDYPKD